MDGNQHKKLIKGAYIVNENTIEKGDVYINGEFIEKVDKPATDKKIDADYEIVDADGLFLMPGVIDDQVHFRDPGLTYKGDIYSESRAAVAGGITSYMDMPNTIPNTLTQELLEEKYTMAAEKSLANFSFYMGASNENIDEVVKTDPNKVCGLKVFMGSSTGNMLIDKDEALEAIFRKAPLLVAVHCEDEGTIQANFRKYRQEPGDEATAAVHPLIRSAEACFLSSSKAVKLAEKYGTRLHIIHLSTRDEMKLFKNQDSLEEKRITSEVCVHHLWFSDEDYKEKGNFIKWNPAVKSKADKEALLTALIDGKLDVVATDHAPHTLEEKERPYFKAPSGGPMVQHSLVAMLELVKQGKLTTEMVVEKMCHNPALIFNIEKRGFIREGYYADLVLVDPRANWTVSRDQLHYKCGWSPMEGTTFHSQIRKTFVNGFLAYDEGVFNEKKKGKRLLFNRNKKL